MVDLLLKQHFFHIFASFGAKQRPRMDALQQRAHLARGKHVFPSLRGGLRIEQNALQMRCAQPQRAEALVEQFQPEAAQDQVGGHVVAQGHHQLAQRVQPHLRLIAEEPQRPAGRHALPAAP